MKLLHQRRGKKGTKGRKRWTDRQSEQPPRLQSHYSISNMRTDAGTHSCACCGSTPHQTEESHVKANLEVTSSQFSLIHFKVSPLKAGRKIKQEKNETTKGVTASVALLSFTAEQRCQKLPCAQILPHKHTAEQRSLLQLRYKNKKTAAWLSGVSSSGLSTRKARRAALLSTRLISASSRRGQQSKALLRYPTIPQRRFFSPGRPEAAACHSLCAQQEPGRTTEALAAHRLHGRPRTSLPTHSHVC